MKINKSRKWTESVMAHEGFGALTIIKDGAKITVPEIHITSVGTVKESIQARLECLTMENIKILESKGVICEVNVMSQVE